jgi:hypothetical protein
MSSVEQDASKNDNGGLQTTETKGLRRSDLLEIPDERDKGNIQSRTTSEEQIQVNFVGTENQRVQDILSIQKEETSLSLEQRHEKDEDQHGGLRQLSTTSGTREHITMTS